MELSEILPLLIPRIQLALIGFALLMDPERRVKGGNKLAIVFVNLNPTSSSDEA